MKQLPAADLFEAINKMKAYPAVNAMVCSKINERKIIDSCDLLSGKKSEPETVVNTFMGITIVASTEIESDHAFFFPDVKSAHEFIDAIRDLKKQGVSWNDIIQASMSKLQGSSF